MTSKILLRFALWFLQEGIGDHRPSIFLTQFKGGGAFLGSQAEPWQDAMMQENEQVGFVTLLYIYIDNYIKMDKNGPILFLVAAGNVLLMFSLCVCLAAIPPKAKRKGWSAATTCPACDLGFPMKAEGTSANGRNIRWRTAAVMSSAKRKEGLRSVSPTPESLPDDKTEQVCDEVCGRVPNSARNFMNWPYNFA